jgi:hypothetical protein
VTIKDERIPTTPLLCQNCRISKSAPSHPSAGYVCTYGHAYCTRCFPTGKVVCHRVSIRAFVPEEQQ